MQINERDRYDLVQYLRVADIALMRQSADFRNHVGSVLDETVAKTFRAEAEKVDYQRMKIVAMVSRLEKGE